MPDARILVMDDAMDLNRAPSRQRGLPEDGTRHGKLIFWTPDGSCHEGMTPRVGKSMIFIESKRMVPVDTEVTVSLAPVEKDSVEQELAEGMVVWHCPFSDQFKNHGGFGVRLQRRWPKGPGQDLIGRPKEAV